MAVSGNNQTFQDWGGNYDPNSSPQTAPALGPAPSFRDGKDRLLSRWGQSPDTQHPDGYLGTQAGNTRRSDKLLQGINRQNHRSYSRGVHKGERVNPGDYVWPDELNLDTGLLAQSQYKKIGHQQWAPKQGVPGAEPVRLTNDGKAGPRGVPRGLDRVEMEPIDPQRRALLKNLAPRWR